MPMKVTTTTVYDTADYLNTAEEIVLYLEATCEKANGDVVFIARALGNVARSKGIAKVVREDISEDDSASPIFTLNRTHR